MARGLAVAAVGRAVHGGHGVAEPAAGGRGLGELKVTQGADAPRLPLGHRDAVEQRVVEGERSSGSLAVAATTTGASGWWGAA